MELTVFYQGPVVEKLTFPIPQGIQKTTQQPGQLDSITEDSSNYVQKITERVYRAKDGSWHYKREATVIGPRRRAGDDYETVVNPVTGKVETVKNTDIAAKAPVIDLADQIIIDPKKAAAVKAICCDGYEVYRATNAAGE